MSWVLIGILIGIGLIIAPFAIVSGIALISLIGLPVLGGVIGFAFSTAAGTDPVLGTVVGVGFGAMAMLVALAVNSQRSNRRKAEQQREFDTWERQRASGATHPFDDPQAVEDRITGR